MTAVTTPRISDLDHTPGTRLVFGCGAIDHLGQLAVELGATRVFLVSDSGVATSGHTSRGAQSLVSSGLSVTQYVDAHENPTTADIESCLIQARAAKPDLIVGLGGGSSLDTAKGCNLLLTNGGRIVDYHGVGKANKEMLPFIAVPTTHGTGSETQSFALIADSETHMKMACGDPKLLPAVARVGS